MRSCSILICLSLALTTNAFGASREFNPASHQPMPESGPALQRVIVKLRAAADTDTADTAAAAGTTRIAQRAQLSLRESRRIAGSMHLMQVEPTVSGESVESTLARLRADPDVEYAEADQRRYAHAAPNDPLYAGQWYLQNSGTTPSAVNASAAWDTTTGSSGLVIADIDTGVRYDHPDLLRAAAGGRLLPGYDFISDIPDANDGNGRDADATDPGDWVSSADRSTAHYRGCSVSDSTWHGTRVAGILGAITNNSTGVAGLTWNALLLPVRVLGKCGGNDSDIIEAMLWAAGVHVAGIPDNPYPAKIENLSLGGSGACPQSYRDVITQLTARGVLVVASAGNEGGAVDAPANCSGVAGIAGLRHVGTKVGYSNLGPQVAVSAPAGNCVNTALGEPCLYSIDTTYNTGTTTAATNAYTDQFNTNLGTSFSTPIATGIAALMKAVNGNLNSSQLIARLKEGASPFPVSSDPAIPTCQNPSTAGTLQDECNCTTQTCGAGMANAANAVTAALRPIAAVRLPTQVAPGQNVVLQGDGSAAACHHNISTYSWAIVSGGIQGISGANTATATLTAPSAGSYTVRLTVTDDAGRQDSADVVLHSNSATSTAPVSAGTNACLNVTVAVSPVSASLQAGNGTQVFTATVMNSLNTAVTWKVNNLTGGNATVGTISTTGVYTAPATVPSPATVTITAVSVADTGRTGTAQVTITTAPIASGGSGSGGGGGGGGALDALTLLASVLLLTRRVARQKH